MCRILQQIIAQRVLGSWVVNSKCLTPGSPALIWYFCISFYADLVLSLQMNLRAYAEPPNLKLRLIGFD